MKTSKKYIVLVLMLILSVQLQAQVRIMGKVTAENGAAVAEADVFLQNTGYLANTDKDGYFELKNIPYGTYTLAVFYMGKATMTQEVVLEKGQTDITLSFQLHDLATELDNVVIESHREVTEGITRLQSVEGFGIYEAKKNEVIVLDDMVFNKAANNARQIFAKVSGLNIWESDCAGLQIGVGGRGLSPNRSSNFNMRQNGYDMSADALGYPESYYSPAIQAVERIEIVRGAASLQYGTQFGGLVNFVMKEGPEDKKFSYNTEQTGNSLGFYSGFNSVGGTIGKVNYYAYNRYVKGDCWRCNSDFESVTSYAAVKVNINDKLRISSDYTHMTYLAQQSGGLTDVLFEQDPKQSIRERNWFRINWNLFSLTADYRISDRLKVNVRNFGLIGGRDALGNLGRIDRTDNGGERDLLVDDFKNFGNETRLIYNYNFLGQPSVLLVGGRYYRGQTLRTQGLGPDGKDADFHFLNPDNVEGSDFTFPSTNVSAFAENIFNITSKLSITPGVRFEYINTESSGYYQSKTLVVDPVTGMAKDSIFSVNESKSEPRSFMFGGIGASYKVNHSFEIYANYSQNFRSINFNDIRVVNPNLVVDPNIHDETGYNADIGVRGGKSGVYNFDMSMFYLRYNDRIGAIQRVDNENFRIYRFRTNISDSRNVGFEAFGELNLNHWINMKGVDKLNLFANVSLIDARYINSEESGINNKQVEYVPPFSLKTGLAYTYKDLQLSYQFSYTHEHFTDASNALSTPSAIEGLIPSYYIMDLAASYSINKYFGIEAGVNNITDNHYFTRRASGYPGPGIIPSDGRSFYVTLKGHF